MGATCSFPALQLVCAHLFRPARRNMLLDLPAAKVVPLEEDAAQVQL